MEPRNGKQAAPTTCEAEEDREEADGGEEAMTRERRTVISWNDKQAAVGFGTTMVAVRQEEARLVQQHRIYAGDKALSSVVMAGEVPPNDVVSYREEAPTWTLCTPDARFLADALYPFVPAGRRVTHLPSFPTFESPRIYVLSASEEGAEQRDLCLRGGRLPNALRTLIHQTCAIDISSGETPPNLPTSSRKSFETRGRST